MVGKPRLRSHPAGAVDVLAGVDEHFSLEAETGVTDWSTHGVSPLVAFRQEDRDGGFVGALE